MSRRGVDWLELVPRYLYRGRGKRLLQSTGLVPLGKRVYFELYSRAAGGARSVRIGEHRATFELSTYEEYHVVKVAEEGERPLLSRLLGEVRPDDVFYDVGANVGTFSCLVGGALADGRVVAFEPYPPNVERLRENAARNDVDVEVVPVALSDRSGEMALSVVDSTNPGTQESTIDVEYPGRDRTVSTVPVRVESGDALVRERRLPPPTVMKIDTEGSAPAVLRGFEGTLSGAGCRIVCVEPHGNRAAIESILRSYGYDVEHVALAGGRQDDAPTVFATK